MSRQAGKPVSIPKGVEVQVQGQHVAVKGGKGKIELDIHNSVAIKQDGDSLLFASIKKNGRQTDAMVGTMRALVNNMLIGVSEGFVRKLELSGVGYRAQAQGKKLNLTLGYSHPINYLVPEGITVETPSQTEIIIKGVDKQMVGQVAAEIRAFRPPEPYKGKGVKYSDEQIIRKEAKKT